MQSHQQQQQLLLQSSASTSLITGASLLPQQASSTGGNPLTLAPLPPPPPDEERDLPLNWKTARDANGKVYYYHSITRKTQWERPTDKDVEGTITMDLGTPESESEGDAERTSAPRGPRTPPDISEEEGQPYTPEGSPPRTPKRYKGPRTPSPTRYSSSRRRSHHRRRSRSSKVKGPRTPSPVYWSPVRSRSSSSHSPPTKTSNSPSPHSRGREDHAPSFTTTVMSPRPSTIDETVPDNRPITEEQLTEGRLISQVENSGSNSPTLKPDSPKPHSPSPVPSCSPSPLSPELSSPQDQSSLNISLVSSASMTDKPADEPTPPPRKRHRGEGKVKSKATKVKEHYRHKVSELCTYGGTLCMDSGFYQYTCACEGLAGGYGLGRALNHVKHLICHIKEIPKLKA